MVFRRGQPGEGGFMDDRTLLPSGSDLATGPGLPLPPPPSTPTDPGSIPPPLPGEGGDPGLPGDMGGGDAGMGGEAPPYVPLDYSPTALTAPTFARPDQPTAAAPYRTSNFLRGRVVGAGLPVAPPGPGSPLAGGLPLNDVMVQAAIAGLRRKRQF